MSAPTIRNVAVFGGTARLGLIVATAFVDRVPATFDSVVIISRSSADKLSDEAKKLLTRGAQLRTTDYSHDSLVNALQGMDAVVSCVAGDALVSQVEWASACAAVGIKVFIPSEFGTPLEENPPEDDYYKQSALRVREAYRKAGIPTATICNGWFLDIGFVPFLDLNMDDKTVGIVGDGNGPITWTMRKDIATTVCWLLESPDKWWSKMSNGLFELSIGGDHKTWNEIVALIEKQSGVTLSRTYIPIPTVREQLQELRKAGKSAWETIIPELQVDQAEGKHYIPEEQLMNDLVFGEQKMGDVESFVEKTYGRGEKI